MSTTDALVNLDLRGKSITTFIVHRVHSAFQAMHVGDRAALVADADPAIEADLAAWCRTAGHGLVDVRPDGAARRYVIEKGERAGPAGKLAMIVSDDGLLELLSPLGFALASALEGMEVSLYFQGPAVRVLARGFTPRLHGMARPFSRFPRSGLERSGHVAPQEKLRQLRELGGRLYVCGASMEHFGVAADQLAFDDVTVAAYFTFMEVMSQADVTLFPS